VKEPTIHILFPFVDTAWGGANQFLKALKGQFLRMGIYEEYPAKADVILFISYPFRHEHFFSQIHNLRKLFHKTIVHRVDGPISLIRGFDFSMDRILYYFNSKYCDGTIFQSKWSLKQNLLLGMKSKAHETTIINAPDPSIFFPHEARGKCRDGEKIKLIATSWSANVRKGFDIYKFLDENLDFEKYEMSFYGRSPIAFERIKHFQPIPSLDLAERLRGHDIFITASTNDPCSNSLIEALHCGLPAIVRNTGGHPEIIGKAGVVFTDERDILDAINIVADDLYRFRKEICLPNLYEVATEYYEFCKNVHNETCERKKKARLVDLLWIKTLIKMHSIGQYVRNKMNRLV